MRTTLFIGLLAVGLATQSACRSDDNPPPDLASPDMSLDMPVSMIDMTHPIDMADAGDMPASPLDMPDLLNVDLYSPLFAPAVNYPIGDGPIYMAGGDINKDGLRDLVVVVANDPTNSLGMGAKPSQAQVLIGVGDGTFQLPVNYTVPNFPGGVRLIDLDGDTKLDLLIVTQASGVGFMKGNGDGTFAAVVSYAAGTTPTSLAIGDIDGDGKVDAVAASLASGKVAILRGNGNGTFTAAVEFVVTPTALSRYALDVAVFDMNNDSKNDIVTVNLKEDGTSGSVSILASSSTVGSVSFATPIEMNTADGANAVLVGQIDGANKGDIVVSNSNAKAINVFLSNTTTSAITFAASASYALGASPNALALGDIDGDGHNDIVSANFEGSITVLHGLATAGTFGLLETYNTHGDPAAIVVGTFNADAKLDVATANQVTDDVSVFINQR